MNAALPDAERDRLDALAAYSVLDTPAEAEFDRITQLAAHLFEAPIAMVSLVDDHRQWFKSAHGLDACSTPRSDSFCAHALALPRGGVLVVEDATKDPRFAGNPSVVGEPGVRFYAGALLMSASGHGLGALCVVDTAPRPRPSDYELVQLRTLADMVVDHLEARRARLAARAEQTNLFENAFHHAPIGLALVDLEGAFTKINSAFADLVGYSVDELLATSFQDITYPDDLDRDLELLHRLTAGEIPSYQMDKRYLRKDGRVVWVNLSVSLIRHDDGSPKHFIAQVQDLTARMEAEARYRLMAENARDMIVTCDRYGRSTFVSASCKAIAGWTPAEAIGAPMEAFVHPDDVALVRDAYGRTAAGETVGSIRWRGWNQARGAWMWLESSPSVLHDHGELGFVDVFRDVEAQVALEAELRTAKAAAEAAVEVKAQFLANMSHELRTPLTSIIGFSGLAGALPNLPERARDYLGRVQTASQALLSLVNDVLDFSKLEADEVTLSPRPVDVAALCRRVADMFGAQSDAKELTLMRDLQAIEGRVLMLDPDRVRQVILNLMSNALKFTREGGVELRARMNEADGRLRISVRDTGPGIPADKLDQLFRRFSQIDGSNTRTVGGTGLGLAISKALVERMGGEIGVESREGAGSTFWFELPVDAAKDGPTPAADEARAVPLPGVRVLVVDDHVGNRDLAQLFLEGAGAEVETACGGAEAVETAAALPFDVVLMDVRMPDMDGPAALAAIRAAPGPNDATPILAFTANAEAAEVALLRSQGFDDVVPKPITPRTLLQAVASAIRDQLADVSAVGELVDVV